MHLFRYIVEHVGLHCHIHVHCPYNPAELALPHVEHSVYIFCFVAGQLVKGWLACSLVSYVHGAFCMCSFLLCAIVPRMHPKPHVPSA